MHKAGELAAFRYNTHVYILYLRCEDAILAILCTGLPITTTIAGKQLNSLIFHGNIKCIIANGQTIIYVVGIYMSCDDHSFCA